MAAYERWPRYTPVCLTWVDACSVTDGWTPEREVSAGLRVITTVGMLYEVTDELVAVGQDAHLNDGGEAVWHSVGAVPRVCVLSIEKLGEPRRMKA